MADEERGLEQFHVPQRSRRDKLRVVDVVFHHPHHQPPPPTSCQEAEVSNNPPPPPPPHHHHHHPDGGGDGGLIQLPLSLYYDSSSDHQDLLPTGMLNGSNTHQTPSGVSVCSNSSINTVSSSSSEVVVVVVKEGGHGSGAINLMAAAGGYGDDAGFMMSRTTPNASNSSSQQHLHHLPNYMDHPPHESYLPHVNLNPNNSSIVQHIQTNHNPYALYNQSPRDFSHHHRDESTFMDGGEVENHHHHHHHHQVMTTFKQPQAALSFTNNDSRTNHNVVLQGGLALSLSSHHHHHHPHIHTQQQQQQQHQNINNISHHRPLGYNDQPSSSSSSSMGMGGYGFSWKAGPLGSFSGYAMIVKESIFLKPAQQLLEECCYGDHHQMEMEMEMESVGMNIDDHRVLLGSSIDHHDENHIHHHENKSRLISLLDEVYRRYKQYYQQMVSVVASFESVAGLGNAAPCTSFALKALSKNFKGLKNAMTDQLYFTSKDSGEGSLRKDHYPNFGTFDRHVHSQRLAQQGAGILENQHAWRPQRGLPERAVAVLRAWLFEHFLHPYPTDTDKQMLAKQTGPSRSQVSNWFINARVRLWKPMVEEIHTLETRQAQKASEAEDQNVIKINEPLSATNSPPCDRQPQTNSTLQSHDPPLKRSRNELPQLVPKNCTNDQMNFDYSSFSSHQHVSAGVSNASANNEVSLTLGLCQNNVIGLSEVAFPMNIAQRFGLEANNEGYVMGSGFEASNSRHFGKDIGGQLLHDFVG